MHMMIRKFNDKTISLHTVLTCEKSRYVNYRDARERIKLYVFIVVCQFLLPESCYIQSAY